MEENIEMLDNLNSVFSLIEKAIDDDNILDENEFNKIQSLKNELNVSSKFIHDNKKQEIERILYLQFYLLLLDDDIDLSERKELDLYKKIFGYNESELFRIELKVRQEKKEWNDRKETGFQDLYTIKQKSRNIPSSIKKIVWDRDEGKCVLCGSTEYLEFDHDIPFSLGGSNSTENIRVLCRNCNRKKSDKIGLMENE